jgi:hypothetical protein
MVCGIIKLLDAGPKRQELAFDGQRISKIPSLLPKIARDD